MRGHFRFRINAFTSFKKFTTKLNPELKTEQSIKINKENEQSENNKGEESSVGDHFDELEKNFNDKIRIKEQGSSSGNMGISSKKEYNNDTDESNNLDKESKGRITDRSEKTEDLTRRSNRSKVSPHGHDKI